MVCSVARLYPQCKVGAITAYCCAAICGRAVLRTKLYAARFGPTDTSYHDMNQTPGVQMYIPPCHTPPRYQAGSLGARLIMAPPVETSARSANMPTGPPTLFMMSASGRCASAFAQSTGGIPGARSNSFDAWINSACDAPAGNIGRT